MGRRRLAANTWLLVASSAVAALWAASSQHLCQPVAAASAQHHATLFHNGFQLYSAASEQASAAPAATAASAGGEPSATSPQGFAGSAAGNGTRNKQPEAGLNLAPAPSRPPHPTASANGEPAAPFNESAHLNPACLHGLATFELLTGFIYKPAAFETLAMMPSTLQLTDCLGYCLRNSSCLAINFEMGLCVLLSSSARHNPANLYSSQFPVFTIYAEKKCLLSGADPARAKLRRRCQRAWAFERVAGLELRARARKRLRLISRELCMDACLAERDFECRSASWQARTGDCALSDHDRHSAPAGLAAGLAPPPQASLAASAAEQAVEQLASSWVAHAPPAIAGLYQNYHYHAGVGLNSSHGADAQQFIATQLDNHNQRHLGVLHRNTYTSNNNNNNRSRTARQLQDGARSPSGAATSANSAANAPASTTDYVDYLENNCVLEPNKLCEFRKIQNKVLKTVDSIYQDVASLDECKQKCLNAPYRCYSFDYGDTGERVCRTSHLDQAALVSVREPYLDVAGAITYELASCFNVTIQCRAREMVAQVSSSKPFKGKIYAKSRPTSCLNDVLESHKFELSMRYHDPACDVRASANLDQGVFSNDIVIQHHDRIVTTQDVGLSVYCQYELANKSITNNVDLAVERFGPGSPDEAPSGERNRPPGAALAPNGEHAPSLSPLTITSLATTVVRSPNVTMRITNINGQPVSSATVGDRLALLFEIKEKTSPFGIFVREIVAMDSRVASGDDESGSNSWSSNHSALEAANRLPQVNSIQMTDSRGCPSADAQVMGPLVRLDQAGHKLLAPFDAFKFPNSDVVFFRAVVSSCVSECAPTECSAEPEQSPSSAQSRAPPLMLSTRNMPTPAPEPPVVTPSRQASSTSTVLTTSTTSLAKVTSPAPALAIDDALTTVAGFNKAPTMAPSLEQGGQLNVTSNHQGSSRPATPPPPQVPQPGPPPATLSSTQRDQLIKQIEAKLRQQSPLATGAPQAIRAGAGSGQLMEPELYTAGALAAALLASRRSQLSAPPPVTSGAGDQPEVGGAAPGVRLADFQGFLAYLLGELDSRSMVNTTTNELILADQTPLLSSATSGPTVVQQQQPQQQQQQQQQRDARRKRSKRDTTGGHLSDYVYLEKVEPAAVATPVDRGMRFTRAVVEMYAIPVLKREVRRARRAPAELPDEELVVQSIKIIDRQVTDRPPTQATRRRHSVESTRVRPVHNYATSASASASKTVGKIASQSPEASIDDEGLSEESGSGGGAKELALATLVLGFVFVQCAIVLVCALDWVRTKPRPTDGVRSASAESGTFQRGPRGPDAARGPSSLLWAPATSGGRRLERAMVTAGGALPRALPFGF